MQIVLVNVMSKWESIAKLGNNGLPFQLPVPVTCFSGVLLRRDSVLGTEQLAKPSGSFSEEPG